MISDLTEAGAVPVKAITGTVGNSFFKIERYL
jgi:hypothetical protein